LAGLAHATFGLWPNRGHGVTGDRCASAVELAFLAGPTGLVDLDCLGNVIRPAFS
jgi:hypothetical protein